MSCACQEEDVKSRESEHGAQHSFALGGTRRESDPLGPDLIRRDRCPGRYADQSSAIRVSVCHGYGKEHKRIAPLLCFIQGILSREEEKNDVLLLNHFLAFIYRTGVQSFADFHPCPCPTEILYHKGGNTA